MKRWEMGVGAILVMFLGAAPVENDNLALGIPGPGEPIIVREGYALGYAPQYHLARWVSYHVTAEEAAADRIKSLQRFKADPEITNAVESEDYRNSNYQRGHLAPAEEMRFSETVMQECYYLSNAVPMKAGCNGGIWQRLERQLRALVGRVGELYIVTGPVFYSDKPERIGKHAVAVPDAFYKVIYQPKPEPRMLAYLIPNVGNSEAVDSFATTVDAIEELTGLDFFDQVSEQERLEAKKNSL